MDVLSEKQTKTYNSLSRYSQLYFFYNSLDSKYIYEIGKNLSENTPYVVHTVTMEDTLDLLALTYYGRPDLFWIIADFNRINDPYISLYYNYKEIKVPTISAIEYED